jgi:hypothetical protein
LDPSLLVFIDLLAEALVRDLKGRIAVDGAGKAPGDGEEDERGNHTRTSPAEKLPALR